MEKSGNFAEKWNATLGLLHHEQIAYEEDDAPKTGMAKVKHVFSIIWRICYHLRKVIMAAPVIYYALKLAAYNTQHLPEMVGINLQSNGAYAEMITRAAAVNGPLAITGVCLVLMLLSRKAAYPWVISIFTLIVPIFLLLTNTYPC